MPSYQGPNVQVRQQFVVTPAAVAVETLPNAVVAAPFDVRYREDLGDSFGIADAAFTWVADGSDKVIYSTTQGTDLFNYYPAKIYARDNDLGEDYELTGASNITLSSTAATVKQLAKYKYFEVLTGSSEAYMPFFALDGGSGSAIVQLPASTKIITVTGGRFVDAKIVPGVDIMAKTKSTSNYVPLGTVSKVISNTQIELAAVYAGTLYEGDAIYVGVSYDSNATASELISRPGYIYDANQDFIREGVKRGDLLAATSTGLSADITQVSIIAVNKNLLKVYTDKSNETNAATGQDPYSLFTYYANDATASFSPEVSTYSLTRFAGFSHRYDTATGSIKTAAGTVNNTIVLSSAFALNVGDKVAIATDTAGRLYTITSQVNSTTYKVDLTITTAVSFPVAAALDVYAYGSSASDPDHLTNEIVADYRAVKVANLHTVFNSRDNELTGTNGVFGETSIYNELSFMIDTMLGVNGGRVMYAYAIDPTLTLSSEYSDALEALKFYDVYSHALGTNDAGVNATIPSYLDEQSDPYEGHERIAVLAYKESDVYKLGEDTCSVTTGGLVTVTGGLINLVTIGLGIGDKVTFTYNSTDYTATVTATPTATTVQTDHTHTGSTWTGVDCTFSAGVPSKQANRVKALGAIANHRTSIVWPGRFWADTQATSNLPAETTVELPAYLLSALVSGMDGGQKVSQSFTRLGTGMPGLSNIQLKTSSVFRKSELDVMGSGGIDILVQDNQISNVIFSRHDLTTDMTGVETRERSITKQADQTAKTFRTSIDPYVGKYNITKALLNFVTMVLNNAKRTLLRQGVVSGLEIKSVKRDPNISDKINIKIKVTVFVAGNYYDIDLTIVSR